MARSRRRCSVPDVIAIIAVLIGIVLAAVILALTGYFTGTETASGQGRRPRPSLTGAATVILSGFSVGFESAVYTALIIGAAVFGAFLLGCGSIVVVAVRRRARRLWPADHGRRHRRHGHLRPGQRQRPGHRGDVRRRRREGRGRSSPSSTRSATPPRPSPRASRSRPPCSRPPRCSASFTDSIKTAIQDAGLNFENAGDIKVTGDVRVRRHPERRRSGQPRSA